MAYTRWPGSTSRTAAPPSRRRTRGATSRYTSTRGSPTAEPTSSSGSGSEGRMKERILIADADALTRRFLGSFLTNHGYEPHEAEDGEAAILKAGTLRPRLLILDLVLPLKDGFEVLNLFGQQAPAKRPPVLILSVRDREEDVGKALDRGG